MRSACHFTIAMTRIIYPHIPTYMHSTPNLSKKPVAKHKTFLLTLSSVLPQKAQISTTINPCVENCGLNNTPAMLKGKPRLIPTEADWLLSKTLEITCSPRHECNSLPPALKNFFSFSLLVYIALCWSLHNITTKQDKTPKAGSVQISYSSSTLTHKVHPN